VSRSPSRIPTSKSNSSSRTGSSARSAPVQPGGVVSRGEAVPAGSGESSSLRSGAGGVTTAPSRTRDGRSVVGTAIPRRTDTTLVSFPLYGPWGRWYPWYGSGFGWNLGFVTYNPWRYGATRWYWGRYGLWYDPYIYDPYWYDPYYSGYGGGGYSRDYDEPKRMTGSIRLKAKPSSASVYIDGALVGKIESFDGLNEGLELDGGTHTLEIRADGYEIYRGEIDVKVGKTLTERVSLKKIKK
jgi:hypothetical protein